jgi:hypothetical protein
MHEEYVPTQPAWRGDEGDVGGSGFNTLTYREVFDP